MTKFGRIWAALGGLFLTIGAANAVELTDATGTNVNVVVDNNSRLVTLGGTTTEIVFALGFGKNIVGTDITSLYPPEQVAALPKVGNVRQVAVEGVLSLKPDLVIATNDLGPPAVIDQLRKAGVVLFILPPALSYEAAGDRILLVGKMLGAQSTAAQIVSSLNQSIKRTNQYISQMQVKRSGKKPRVLFVYARGAGLLLVSGSDTEAAAMIDLAGGLNAVTGFSGYRPLTAEAAVTANPDVILFTQLGLRSLGRTGAKAIPALAQTAAVKQGRVVALDDLYLLGFGPRLGGAVLDLARLINK